MTGVVPTNFTVWTSRGSPSYRSGEGHLVYVGRSQNSTDQTPVIFCHGYLLAISQQYAVDGILSASYIDDMQAICGGARLPVIASDLGGPSTWGNDSVVATGGAIDDLIAWANNPATAPDAVVTGAPVFGTRTDKVVLFAESMGCLNALNWAWRNPGKVEAIVLRAPVVALDAFHDRNSGVFGAIIEAAYGGSPGYEAALATHDPMENLDLIRPFGHRIQCWIGTADEFIPTAEVQAFAELVGAEYHELDGLNHAQTVNTPPDQVGFFILETTRTKESTFLQWEPTDWGRLDEYILTTSASGSPNQYDKTTTVGNRGRRGVITGIAGTDGNDRRALLLPTEEFSAVDAEVFSTWYSADTAIGGQQGHAMRAVIDEGAGTYRIPMAWQNIFFSIPWIINLAVWTGPLLGVDASLTLNGLVGGTIPGLRLASGGLVLASSRSGGIATYQIPLGHKVQVGDLINVTDMTDPTMNADETVLTVTENTFTLADAGADTVSGGDGTYGNYGRCFPYHVRSRIRGVSPAVMDVKAWPPGYDEPAYGDPDWSLTWTDGGSFAHPGYGRAGVLSAHVSLGDMIQFGAPVTFNEL